MKHTPEACLTKPFREGRLPPALRRRKSRLSSGGFTVIEIVVVLVVLGILAAVTVPRIANVPDEALKAGEPDRIKAHLRYTQSLAMHDHSRRYFIAFNGSSYSLNHYTPATAVTETLLLPGETDQTATLQGDISMATAVNIGFDLIGTPLSGTPGSMTSFHGTLALNGSNVSIGISKVGRIYLK